MFLVRNSVCVRACNSVCVRTCVRACACMCVCVCVYVFLAICNRSAACVDVATVTTECVKTNMLECNRTGVRVHIYSFPVPLRGIRRGTRSSRASIAIEERGIQVNSRYNDSGYNIIPVCTYKLLWFRTKHDHSHTILDVYNIFRYNIILVITTKINRPTGS